MSGKALRILLVTAMVVLAFSVVLVPAFAQTGTATPTAMAGGAAGAAATASATPRTLPTTGGDVNPVSTMTVVLLALGATAGLGGLLLRGLRQPR
jgi:hypothetical protein